MKKLLAVIAALFSGAAPSAQPNAKVVASPAYTLNVGKAAVFEFKSQKGNLSVVFEDDGDTGYFYALDYSATEQPIQEAMNIYDVHNVTDKNKPSVVRMAWSPDGTKAGLWINNYPHAVFDFTAKRGYCRTNFPPPGKWKSHNFSWSDDALKFFQ